MGKLFLLEDDLSLISGLTFAFKKQGFALDTARTLAEAEMLWSDGKYDLLVLDVSLPDGSGFDFCQKVRRTSNVPILFLTASDEEMNIIMGLDMGGDDYLTKPFKLGVLLSRVNALLRRANASSAGEPVLESGSITVRLLQGQAYKNEILLELTGAEYKLLCFFIYLLSHTIVVLCAVSFILVMSRPCATRGICPTQGRFGRLLRVNQF